MKFTEICGLDLGSLSLLVGAAAAVVSGRVCVCVCVCVPLTLLLCGTEELSVNMDSGPARPSILKQGNFPVMT